MRPKTRAQEVERARTIGDSKRRFIGRMTDHLKRAADVNPVSHLETKAILPVSFLRWAAL